MKLRYLSLLCAVGIFTLSACENKIIESVQKAVEKKSGNSKEPANTESKKKAFTGVKEKTVSGITNQINYVNGVKQGEARSYYENGKIWKKSNYKDGKLHGKAEVYDRKGRIQRLVTYKDGEPSGDYIRYFKSGKEKLKVTYHNGRPLPGLLRRDYMGKLLPEPTIITDIQGAIPGKPNFYRVTFRLNESLEDVKFFAMELEKNWEDMSQFEINQSRLVYRDGEAIVDFFVKPGYIFTNEHFIVATFEVAGKKRAAVRQKVHYMFENG